MTNAEMDEMERNPFAKPVLFKCKASTILKGWGRFNGTHLETIVTVRAVDAEDTGYVCKIAPNDYVDFGGMFYPASKLCDLLNCSIHKLADLFHDSVKSEVYQHIIQPGCSNEVEQSGV